MIIFSILLATRNRTNLLDKFLESIVNTTSHPDTVEVLAGIDNDDNQTQNVKNIFTEKYKSINLKFFSRQRSEWMHRDYINWMYRYSKGQYILVVNDDTLMTQPGWDVDAEIKLSDYLKDKPDGIVYGSTYDNTGDVRCCCFPLLSKQAVDALGWVLPNERRNWGADWDVSMIYGNSRVNRKLELPEIKIMHLTHHNRTRERDSVSYEIEANFQKEGSIRIDYPKYIERLVKHISFNLKKAPKKNLLVVYNICGLSGKENSGHYLSSIHSIMSQNYPDFALAISSCKSSQETKLKLEESLGDTVYYNWINETLPLNVTFNDTVRKCWDLNGGFDAVIYVDSGIHFGKDQFVIKKMVDRYQTGMFSLVATMVDFDHGLDQWRMAIPQTEDLIMPVGKTCNLHCQLFGKEIYEAFGNLMPDIFASDTSESIFTYMCASVGKKMCLMYDVTLHHKHSLDGASIAYRGKHPLLFHTNETIHSICANGSKIGFGYEECKPVLIHDHSWYDHNENHKNPEKLKEFIKKYCFINESFYNSINGNFVENKVRSIKKMSSPAISCIMVSHNKPQYVREAIESVMNQTFQDWQLILMDSGVLYDQGFFADLKDPRIKVIKTGETEETRRTKAMAPWCFNWALRELVKSDLIVYLCDDDLWYSNAFEAFVKYFENKPHVMAAYASQDLISIFPDGCTFNVGQRLALDIRGSSVNGKNLDCEVDYLQFCHKKEVLRLLGNEWWNETKGQNIEHHADGIFMQRIGELVPIYPIDIKIGQNRRTPISTYGPTK